MTTYPEIDVRRATGRRALVNATKALVITARGNDASDAALKGLIMALRSDAIAILDDDEAQHLIDYFGLWEA